MTAQQLKNSILQMAVQGKLVPQDPSDEPASVLLERIRAEKEQLIKQGKIKREKNPSVIFRGADNIPYEKVGKEVPVSLADEVPFEIPDSWEWVRLGMISTYAHTKRKVNAQTADKSLWGLDLEDIEKGGHILCRKSVGERNATGDKTYFTKGDVLYSKLRPYLQKILVAPDDGICTSEIVPFSLYGNICAEYMVCLLKSPFVDNYINSITYGVKMPRVGTDTMTALLIPLPPLPEQDRIVAKIQELIPFIEKYSASEQQLSKLNATFPEALKKSILQWAVQGKLVDQDPSDEPAEVLLERIRGEKERLVREGKIKKDKHESVIFRRDSSHYEKVGGIERCIDDEIPFEIPQGWCWARLGAEFSLHAGKSIQAANISDVSIGNDYPCYGGNGIRGYVPLSNHTGDYPIIGRQGALCGCINRATGTFYATEHAVCVDTFANTDVAWACYFLTALNLNQYATATAQPGLAVSNINHVLIPVPPLAEQHRIVEKIEELMPLVKAV